MWHVLRNALRRVLHVPVLHVSPKGRRVGGAHVRVAARRSTPFSFEWLRSPRPSRVTILMAAKKSICLNNRAFDMSDKGEDLSD